MEPLTIQKRPLCLGALLVLLPHLSIVEALLEETPAPQSYLDCLKRSTKTANINESPANLIQSKCVRMYLTDMLEGQFQRSNLTQEQQNYFQALHRITMAEMLPPKQKRSTYLRVRKEIRVISDTERAALFQAYNYLKYDTSIKPSVYDAFRGIHLEDPIRVVAAHDGPNFLGWHRYYIYLFETALRTKNPRVVLPYWDSTLDYNMYEPLYTIMFTSKFLGNIGQDGSIISGAFKDWQDFNRDPGQKGSPANPSHLDVILYDPSIIRHAQIVRGLDAPDLQTIEGVHDYVHGWIGGSMGIVRTAPRDPIFYLHHCFIDYIWEAFREKQWSAGIDSEKDYPDINSTLHSPHRPMDFFPWARSIDGYTNNFTTYVYRYEPRPQCPSCGNSRYIRCIQGKCVSASSMAVNEVPMAAVTAQLYAKTPNRTVIFGKQFAVPYNDSRIRGNPQSIMLPTTTHRPDPFLVLESSLVAAASEIAAGFEYIPGYPKRIRRSTATDHAGGLHLPSISIFKTVPNTFTIDEVSDVSRWAFMPVRIIYMRHPGMLDNKTVTNTLDVFGWDPSAHIEQSRLAVYPKSYPLPSGAAKIFIETNGISYKGRYTGYAIIDERQPIIESKVFVAFKNPRQRSERFLVTAYDTYGRVCRTLCKVPRSSPPVYRVCSGAIKSSATPPTMYGDTHAEAIRQQWDLDYPGCPRQKDDVFLTVLCDYQEKWPWDII